MTRLIAFDVDSTLLSVESLDYAIARAARERGQSEALETEVEALTAKGMAGAMRFRESLRERLALGRLTRSGIAGAAQEIAALATPGMAELLADLRGKGDRLIAISGGFRPLITPALIALGFGKDEIFANDFIWKDDEAVDVDTANPLSDNGGKPAVLRALTGGDKVMVGDGATDLEAYTAGAVAAFIGFGGVKKRGEVARNAPIFAEDIGELRSILLGLNATKSD